MKEFKHEYTFIERYLYLKKTIDETTYSRRNSIAAILPSAVIANVYNKLAPL